MSRTPPSKGPDGRTHVVILGAGFGGLELSTRLSEEVPDLVRVTLIDQSDAFVFGFAKLDVLFGRRQVEEVRAYYRHLAHPSVEFRQETVLSIDPAAKTVRTDGGEYQADVLVVALGADYDLPATPGLSRAGHEFYSVAGAERVRGVLEDFEGGVVAIGICGPLFKCPPAPYETAFMLHDFLTARGRRDRCQLHVLTPLSSPIPISPEASAGILATLERCGITFWPNARVTGVDPDTGAVQLEDGRTLACDLFLAVPVHCAPAVVRQSALAEDGWVPVDHRTMATRFPDVYAVGDVTSAPVPRAGVIAEGEARTVAEVLVARLRGAKEPRPFGGEVLCYFESTGGTVGKVEVNFLSGPAPTAAYSPPAVPHAAEKREFGASRRRRWFGSTE